MFIKKNDHGLSARLTFEVGPQLDFAIGKDNDYHYTASVKANGFDFSLTPGSKYDAGQYSKGPNLNFTAKYTIGTTNVYKADNTS